MNQLIYSALLVILSGLFVAVIFTALIVIVF